jgi:hypothetical protein
MLAAAAGETFAPICVEKKAACAIPGSKKFIADGSKTKVECNECTCNDGTLACTRQTCGCDGRCLLFLFLNYEFYSLIHLPLHHFLELYLKVF